MNDAPIADVDPPDIRRCALCCEIALYGFGPTSFPLQPAERGLAARRHEGEWA
jgi:hypothetical protein